MIFREKVPICAKYMQNPTQNEMAFASVSLGVFPLNLDYSYLYKKIGWSF